MGVDVVLYAKGEVSDAELEAANCFLSARLYGRSDDWLGRSAYDPDVVEFDSWGRYYGPGYERGDWPTIYGHIVALRAALPGCTVHYGADSDMDDPPAVTDADLAKIWAHFLGPHGADYRIRP